MNGVLGQILRCALQTVPGAIGAHHRGTVRALSRCRTGELGYLLHVCSDCGDSEQIPKSCGNRHCPQCQGRLARAWLESQQHALLDTPYFHVVCTLPHVLLPLCVAAPRELYALLFEASSGMLLRLGRERLGGEIGITLVLHTWGQQLKLHPHVHAIVTGGALGPNGRWREVKSRRYLFALPAMSAIFRGKVLAGLTRLRQQGRLPEPPGGWPALWRKLGEAKRWVVYCRPPFAGPSTVLAYLANYTHRVAISERRIEHFDPLNLSVRFGYRDYADGGALKSETLPLESFVRRFLLHILPTSFTKIRHYGLLSNSVRSRRLPLARAALATARRRRAPRKAELVTKDNPAAPPRCRHCDSGEPVCVAFITPAGQIIPFLRGPRQTPSHAPP